MNAPVMLDPRDPLLQSERTQGKDAGLSCGSRLRNGEVCAYVGLSQNLKDLKGKDDKVFPCTGENLVGTGFDLTASDKAGAVCAEGSIELHMVVHVYRGTSLIRNTHPPRTNIGS